MANVVLPKLAELAAGKGGARGGGEYLSVTNAWDNAKKGMYYFTQTYAVNSLRAFQIRSAEEAGSEFCRSFISAKGPTSFKTLLEPDSPSTFYARFDTTLLNDVTVPATAHYKVFYSIYAGKDAGVYYYVYLKNPPESSYYSTETIPIANGFIAKGQYASETLDRSLPDGYKELCVRINDKEECGFKQVSTSFAVNYLRDEVVKEELTQTAVKTSQECTSGTASLRSAGGSLLTNLNLEAAAQEAYQPEIAQRGIVRICATTNPGKSTDPLRYVDVGYCDSTNMRCWLDKNSVDNAITDANLGAKNETLGQLAERQRAQLALIGEIYNDSVAVTKIRDFNDRKEK